MINELVFHLFGWIADDHFIQFFPYSMIHLFQPSLGDEELQALKEVFDSNWIGRGRQVDQFEGEFAEMVNCTRSQMISTTSCTEGIFAVMQLYGFGPGDEIVTSVCCFPAIPNAILQCGATLVGCDVDSRTLNMTVETLEPVITHKTRAVFITHFGGNPAEMDAMIELCSDRGILVIEDAATVVGSSYKGKSCGTFGNLGIWSFDSMKMISTGDGGMVFCKNPEDTKWLREYFYLGYPSDKASGYQTASNGKPNWWEYEVNQPGRRSIMNDISGAMGRTQLKKLSSFLEKRAQIASKYDDALSSISWISCPPPGPDHSRRNHYAYWIQTDHRDVLAQFLKENGIYTTFRYWPIHKINHYKAYLNHHLFPGADQAAAKTLLLPIHFGISEAQQDHVIACLQKF